VAVLGVFDGKGCVLYFKVVEQNVSERSMAFGAGGFFIDDDMIVLAS
jgi:hypothetical protein